MLLCSWPCGNPAALNMLHDGREVAFTVTVLLQVAPSRWQLFLSEFSLVCMCVLLEVPPSMCWHPHTSILSQAIGEHQFGAHWEQVGLSPGEPCIAVNARVGHAYRCDKLHLKTAKDNNFQWCTVSNEHFCWNPGKCWWKQMRGVSGGTGCWNFWRYKWLWGDAMKEIQHSGESSPAGKRCSAVSQTALCSQLAPLCGSC